MLYADFSKGINKGFLQGVPSPKHRILHVSPDRGCREATGVEKYVYYLRISNLEVFVALGKIQQLLDDPIFKNGVGSEINSVIPENTSSA